MKRLVRRFESWLFQLENEILLPFLAVGIIVICGFGAISFYNGYTIQKNSLESMARQMFTVTNQNIDFLAPRASQEEIRERYRKECHEYLRITDGRGQVIADPGIPAGRELAVLAEEGGNTLGWKLEFLVDRKAFLEQMVESQRYVVIGAIAALLIIIQASIFISYNIALPIRNMGRTCQEINENRGGYRSYRFEAVRRRDEIGQLATTFELLLKNMDNYTKMEYTSRMSAALAHEIKNPIAGIRSGIQLLQGRAAKEGDRMLCESMIREIDRVTALITDLFTLSVKKDSVRELTALKPILRELELFYVKGLKQQGISFFAEVEGEPEAWLNGNELRQILHNLIGNSVKAIGKGQEGVIRLTARTAGGAQGSGEKRPGRLAEITLTDNGCGMTPEELERAMEPFYTKSVNGIGLGLAIVKKLVEQNRGFLELKSAPGAGTRVRLCFETQSPGETGKPGGPGA